MANFKDRVRDTSTTTGTGTLTLSGTPPTDFQAFDDAYAVGTPSIPYAIVLPSGDEWEVGLGTLSSSTTLTRDYIFSSSNAGAAVNFSAGTKEVFVTWPGVLADEAISIGRDLQIGAGNFML